MKENWTALTGALELVEYSFFVIIPRSILTRSGSIFQSPISESIDGIEKFVYDNNTWYNLTICKKISKNKNM